MHTIVSCLNNTAFRDFSCFSDEGLTSTCNCYTVHNLRSTSFDVNNTDIYFKSDFDTGEEYGFDENKSFNHTTKIHTCFNLNSSFAWECVIRRKNVENSCCHCIDDASTHHIDGCILTKLLFKGLENFTFPVYQTINIDDDYSEISVGQSEKIPSHTVHDNNTDSIFQNETSPNMYNYSLTFLCLSILMIVIVILWILIDWIRFQYRKNKDDTIPLTLLTELDF